MRTLRKILFVLLVVMNGFLTLTAILGGFSILIGINVPSVEQLSESIFKGVTIPGIALFLVVGGSALVATILLIRRSKFSILSSTIAGIIIMFFEFVEVMIIGSPAGVAQTLQIFYFGLGTLIVCLSMCIWFIDLLANPGLRSD